MFNQTEICSLCGLFGTHQGHEIVQTRELKELSSKLSAELKTERQTLKSWDDIKNADQFKDLFKRKVKEQFTECRKKTEVMYNVV